jgi:hypothetical protein
LKVYAALKHFPQINGSNFEIDYSQQINGSDVQKTHTLKTDLSFMQLHFGPLSQAQTHTHHTHTRARALLSIPLYKDYVGIVP